MPLMTQDSSLITRNARRQALHTGLGLTGSLALTPLLTPLLTLGGCAGGPGRASGAAPGFTPVPAAAADKVTVPAGYSATPLLAWGEPVGIAGAMPAWLPDASNSAADQAVQLGMNHGGVQFIALDGSRRGLLVLNHASTDDGLLYPRGTLGWSAEKVKKAQAAHGLSVVEVELKAGAWQQVRPSKLARRITASTPMTLVGPAAGHALLKTAADATGRRVLGTLAGGAIGMTPWGTCLAGEGHLAEHFAAADQPTQHERRWGLRGAASSRWHEHDERFDAVRHPGEPNRHGWVVELDPMDPASTPVKRTALGRAAHAGVWTAVTRDGRAVVFSGAGERSEFLYKFVSRDKIKPAAGGRSAAQVNAALLDHGTLYVARFDADGSGRWLALVQGQGPLSAAAGFADAGEMLIKSRQASDALGGTPLEPARGLAIDPASGWVYAALGTSPQAGKPKPDRLIRWRDEGDFHGERFVWNALRTGADAAPGRPQDKAFEATGTLAMDGPGRLWLCAAGDGELLSCHPAGGEPHRFLSGPVNSALAGISWTPDGRTMFVNVQHPGQGPGRRSDPGTPRKFSNWPDFKPDGRPRSATLAIRRNDGGVIGG